MLAEPPAEGTTHSRSSQAEKSLHLCIPCARCSGIGIAPQDKLSASLPRCFRITKERLSYEQIPFGKNMMKHRIRSIWGLILVGLLGSSCGPHRDSTHAVRAGVSH